MTSRNPTSISPLYPISSGHDLGNEEGAEFWGESAGKQKGGNHDRGDKIEDEDDHDEFGERIPKAG